MVVRLSESLHHCTVLKQFKALVLEIDEIFHCVTDTEGFVMGTLCMHASQMTSSRWKYHRNAKCVDWFGSQIASHMVPSAIMNVMATSTFAAHICMWKGHYYSSSIHVYINAFIFLYKVSTVIVLMHIHILIYHMQW